MKLELALLVLATALVGCSDDAATAPVRTPQDTGSRVEVEGPITERPDDGVDTSVTSDSEVADSATGDTGRDSTPDALGGVTVVTVGAAGTSFVPAMVTIKVGERVRWVFASSGHNVVSGAACVPDNKFCSPADLTCATAPTAAAGASYERTFTSAGTFPYFCAPHCSGGMVGSVVVTP